MALFSMRMQVIKRSGGRSSVAAAAYRSGEKLHDQRQDITHDYRNRGGVEHCEILVPDRAPAWVRGIDREALWNAVEAGEKRKDAQTARELRLMIPRELPAGERIALVRDYARRCFVAKGMVADICWHNKIASDGQPNTHAHVMLTMRPLTADGFGPKSRHEWVPCPEGRTHADGRPVTVASNKDSWNCPAFYENCREEWEHTANAALERVGSAARIDRRSLLERGMSRLPEPALRLAFHLKELRGVLKDRFGQWQYAKHYQAVEQRAKTAFERADRTTGNADTARAATRLFAWLERQIDRLDPARAIPRDAPRREPADHSPSMER